jgi:hypothetical protein
MYAYFLCARTTLATALRTAAFDSNPPFGGDFTVRTDFFTVAAANGERGRVCLEWLFAGFLPEVVAIVTPQREIEPEPDFSLHERKNLASAFRGIAQTHSSEKSCSSRRG